MSSGSGRLGCCGCGTRLSEGVCPRCALGELFSGSGSLPLAAGDGVAELDVEFGAYTLRTRLASGGMGVVYLAEDRTLKRQVALKMIRGASFAGEAEVARFRIEAEAAAGLDHPNIVPIYDVGLYEGQPFFTMKLIDGESLAGRLKRVAGGRLGAGELAELMVPIARAVHHAHQRGVLHRDLKPGNILIDAMEVPWLTDFGLAKLMHRDSGLTLTSDHLGTPNYMPPEVAGGGAGGVSTASDIWALGVILWEGLCGEAPFRGAGTMEIMRKIAESEPVVPKGVAVDDDLLTLARRCLEKDPARRLESAGMVADELERKLRGEPLVVRRVTRGERLVKWVRRKPAWAALAAAVAVGGLSSASLWWKAESTADSLSEAEVLKGEAEAISQAAQLAFTGWQVINENPARAALLAVESLEGAQRGLGRVLPESASAMFATLQRVGGWDISPRGVRVKEQDDAYIDRGLAWQYRPRFSPDGRWCVTLDPGERLEMPWGEVADAVRAGVFDLRAKGGSGKVAEWTLWSGNSLQSTVHWLSDSEQLVSVDDSGAVRLWTPALESGRVGGAGSRLVGRIGLRGMAIYRSWLKPCEDGPGLEGFVVYEVPRSRQEEFEGKPVVGCLERFRVEVGGGGLRVVRGEAHDLPELSRYHGNWQPSPDFAWLYCNHEDATSLYQLGESGATLSRGVIRRGAERIHHNVFDAGSRWLAVRRGATDVVLYDLGAGCGEDVVESGRTIYTNDTSIEVMALSDDGTRLALGGTSPEVVVLDLEAPDAGVTRLSAEASWVFGLNFSGDGEWLAAGSRERTVMLWRIGGRGRGRGGVGTELRGLSTAVLGVEFSPDGRSLVATGSGSHNRRWAIGEGLEGHLPEVLAGSATPVNDLVRSPDGRWLAAAHGASGNVRVGEPADCGFVKIVETGGGREMVLVSHGGAATGVAFSADGRWLASSGRDGKVNVWEVGGLSGAIEAGGAAPEPVFVFDTSMVRLEYDRRLAFAPGGVLFCTCGDGVLFEWDLRSTAVGEEATGYGLHSLNYLLPDVEVSPDGRRMAVARHAWDTEPREGWTQVGNMVLLFDLPDSGGIELVAELPAHFLGTTKLSFSADSRLLAAGAAGTGVSLWDLEVDDVAGSRITAPISAHLLEAVAFSPDGKWLAIGASDGRICLWNWRREREIWTIWTGYSQSSLVWLDDTRLASAGTRGGVLVWETDLLKLIELARASAGRELHEEECRIFRISRNNNKLINL